MPSTFCFKPKPQESASRSLALSQTLSEEEEKINKTLIRSLLLLLLLLIFTIIEQFDSIFLPFLDLGYWVFFVWIKKQRKKKNTKVMATVNGYQGNTPVAAPTTATAPKQPVNTLKTVDTQSVLKRYFFLWFSLLWFELGFC